MSGPEGEGVTQTSPFVPAVFPEPSFPIFTPIDIPEFILPDLSWISGHFSSGAGYTSTVMPLITIEGWDIAPLTVTNVSPLALPDTYTAFATDAGERLRLGQISDGTGLLSNDGSPTGPVSIAAVNGESTNVSTQGDTVRVEGSNGGVFRIFKNGNMDFRFAPHEVVIGETTGFEYTITDAKGATDTTTVEVLWEEAAPNYDLFAALTPGDSRLAKQDDATALLWGQKTPDGDPITITEINGNPVLLSPVNNTFSAFFSGSDGGFFTVYHRGVIDFFLSNDAEEGGLTGFEYTTSAPVNGSTTGRVDVAAFGFANADVTVLYGNDLTEAAGGTITIGAIDDGTDALSNDIDTGRIVAVNGDTSAVGKWVDGSDGGQFRVFEFGAVQFRDQGGALDLDGFSEISYTIAAPGASGDSLTSTFTVDLIDRPSEIFAADDAYSVPPEALSVADGKLFRLASVDTGGGAVLLDNDFLVPAITQVNGAALQDGVFFAGSNGGMFRVFSGGVVDFVNRGPDKVAAGETTSFTYASDDSNAATVTLTIEEQGDGPLLPRSFGAVFGGRNGSERSGVSVSTAGDINGDGFDDILIGSDRARFTRDPGEAYVIYGGQLGVRPTFDLARLDGKNGFVLTAAEQNDAGGRSVSSAGDVNGDGFDDMLIGAFQASVNGPDSGATHVVFGAASGLPANLDLSTLDGSNGFTLAGIDPGDFSGFSVSSAGDVNSDGFDDILIGAFRASVDGDADVGETYVVYGAATGFSATVNLSALDGSNGFTLQGIDAGDASGASISAAGDVNGDGFGDILISASTADPNGESSGETYLVYGAATGLPAVVDLASLDGADGFVMNGIDSLDLSGRSVSSSGDINGDGFDDILIGANGSGADRLGTGEAYVVYGAASGLPASLDLSSLDGSNGFVMKGVGRFDQAGASVASAGDVNGDGYDDILIGAPVAGSLHGETYLVYGAASGLPASLDLAGLDGTDGFVFKGIERGNRSGSAVSSAGDVNGDGFDDILIGASSAGFSAGQSGETYLVYGGQVVLEGFDAADGLQDGSIELSHVSDTFLI